MSDLYEIYYNGETYTATDADYGTVRDFFNAARRSRGFNGNVHRDTIDLWIEICKVFTDVLKIVPSMTIRQVFYQLVSKDAITKDEAGYKKVMRQIRDMRRVKLIPYSWVADNTRWVRRPNTYRDATQFLEDQCRHYKKSVWESQPNDIEIWCEKDALAGVIGDVTYSWDVPLYVAKGYSSDTLAYNAVNAHQDKGKPVRIYYFGDWDPSGVQMAHDLEKKIRAFASEMGVDITFERCAVLPGQIKWWKLPTRPTKKSDPRYKNFEGESVELDAIPPKHLQDLVTGIIRSNIDTGLYDRTLQIEKVERENLEQVKGIFNKLNLGQKSSGVLS